MDIAIDKNIEYERLKEFIELEFAHLNFFLVYDGVNDWEDVKEGKTVLQYFDVKEIEAGFKYGLNILLGDDHTLILIENISLKLSREFDCRTMCKASIINAL